MGGHHYVVLERMEIDHLSRLTALSKLASSLRAENWQGGDSDLGTTEFERRNANGTFEFLSLHDENLMSPCAVDYGREMTAAEVFAVRVTHFGANPFARKFGIP